MQPHGSQCALTAPIPFTPPSVRGSSTIRFSGALDAFTVRDALGRMDAVVEGNPRKVIVDLSFLAQLDSAGVHALVSLHKRVTAYGGKVVVVGAHDQPLAVLQVLKLSAVFGV